MNVKILIDSIVRQTTVLIAQLATAGGVRAPRDELPDAVEAAFDGLMMTRAK